MHEIAVNCVIATYGVRFGLTKFDHTQNEGARFRKTTVPMQGTVSTGLWVPAKAVPALLLQAVPERTGCGIILGRKTCVAVVSL